MFVAATLVVAEIMAGTLLRSKLRKGTASPATTILH